MLDALTDACYFLTVEKNKYRFSILPNLNKILADRRASIQPQKVEERVKAEVQKIFSAGSLPVRQAGGMERVYFPEKSNQVSDRPAM